MFTSRGFRGATQAPLCAALLLTVSCLRHRMEDTNRTSRSRHIQLYGTDGNMQNSFVSAFKEKAGVLDGMEGTTPLTPLSGDSRTGSCRWTRNHRLPLRRRVLRRGRDQRPRGAAGGEHRPGRNRRADSGGDQRGNPLRLGHGVPRPGPRRHRHRLPWGVDAARAGFTDVGEPSTASYATLHFDEDSPSTTPRANSSCRQRSAASSARAPGPEAGRAEQGPDRRAAEDRRAAAQDR